MAILIVFKNYNCHHFGCVQPQEDIGQAYPSTCCSSYTALKFWKLFVPSL